jgi:hypothetical protein
MSESEQNLAGQQIHEEKLRRYLLGQCSADESAEIELAAFRDNSVSDALSVIEDELTEDYVGDELNDFDRSCFELKFLTSSERREKVRLSALLSNRAEVLHRVPPSIVRAHQLISQEMKEALERTMEGSRASALVADGALQLPREALPEKMSGSIPIAVGSDARRPKRWMVLGGAAGLLLVVLYGVRVWLSTPVNTTSPALNPTPPVLNPTPSIASVTLEDAARVGVAHAYSRESAVLIVNGGNFTAASTVQWNGSNRETLFVNSTTLYAIGPKSDLAVASASKIRIVVVNPPPGGGPSPPFILSPTSEK